jgi:hypothetical protein
VPDSRPLPETSESLPAGDYVSPGLEIVRPDHCFPHMVAGDKLSHPWKYLRREVPHTWYCDRRRPLMGFMGRDEAVLLYNIAKQFRGRPALEIGCWLGWSTCHLALGGVRLDVVDPILAEPMHHDGVEHALRCGGVRDAVSLHAAASPGAIGALATKAGTVWELFVIDGDHEPPMPELDVEACLEHAAADVAFVFHDLASPDVAAALRRLEARGFNVMVYQTMQIMGIAWRGRVTPVHHVPDPAVAWQLPHHLVGLPVSGVTFSGYPVDLRARMIRQDQEIHRLQGEGVLRHAEIERLNQDSQRRDRDIQRLGEDNERRERDIQRLNEELQQRDREIRHLNEELQQRDREIRHLNEELQQRDREIRRLNEELQQRDREIKRLSEAAQDASEERRRQSAEIQRLGQEFALANARLTRRLYRGFRRLLLRAE